MSNSTQNDEIKQMEKAIDEGFAESEKFLKGMKTPFDKSSTQNDHETHTACIERIKKEGASATCCHCNPHDGCTLEMKPTQNDWYDHAVKNPGFKSGLNALKNDTQNDWAERLTLFINHAWSRGSNWAMKGFGYANDTNADREAELAIELVNNLLADARREVIKRIESVPDKDVRSEITVWLEPKEFCQGYNEALKDVLGTLKEEQI